MQLHPEQLDEAELPRDENTSFLVIGFWEFHEKNQEGAHATVFFLDESCAFMKLQAFTCTFTLVSVLRLIFNEGNI